MFGKARFSSASALDPFSFWPGAASSIRGLGGTDPPADPAAVFHTQYISLSAGPNTAELAFEGLSASAGTMTVELLAIAHDVDAKVQSRAKMDLADLAGSGGRYRLPFVARQDTLYALYARVEGAADPRADALSITLDRPPATDAFVRKLTAARDTIFSPGKHSGGLVVDRVATLARPVSQMCTAAQFDEPDYARWLGLIHRPIHRHRKQWEYVYICRVLESMAMLQPGFCALGFGCGVEPLPAAFAAHGMHVTASDLAAEDVRASDWRDTNQHSLSLDALSDPAICPPEQFSDRVELAAIDMNAIPHDRRGYDLCWSSCSLEHLGSIAAGLDFIERSLDTLRPGGVAVHTTEFNLSSNRQTLSKGGTVLFRRRDIEKLARRLRRRGHAVAPITFDQGNQPEDMVVDMPPYSTDRHYKLALGQYVTTSFGLVVRKHG